MIEPVKFYDMIILNNGAMQAIGILAPLIRRLGARADPRYAASYSIWAMYVGMLSPRAISNLVLLLPA